MYYPFLLCALAGLSTSLGAVFVILGGGINDDKMSFYEGFAAGVMLAVSRFDLIPESYKSYLSYLTRLQGARAVFLLFLSGVAVGFAHVKILRYIHIQVFFTAGTDYRQNSIFDNSYNNFAQPAGGNAYDFHRGKKCKVRFKSIPGGGFAQYSGGHGRSRAGFVSFQKQEKGLYASLLAGHGGTFRRLCILFFTFLIYKHGFFKRDYALYSRNNVPDGDF